MRKFLAGLFIPCLLAMLWSYHNGYSSSIDWEVTTTGEIIEFPAWSLETDLMTHEIKGEKYLLSENYSGSEIKRNLNVDKAFMALMWIGLCLTLAASTYLKRYAFFVIAALFALFLNRLNLFEVGLFEIQSKMVILIPFIGLIVPLIIFHEYKKNIPFTIRAAVLIGISGLLLVGVGNATLFTDHLIAHSVFGYTICGILFLFIISEEIIFTILYVVTSGKGGRSNHIHFLVLSLIYLGNLVLYYLNKSGLYENSFFYFDPFVLLTITCLISMWSIKYKANFLSRYFTNDIAYLLTFSLGIVTLLFIAHQMIRGNDGVYEAFHYFILYFHIGFGALFFLYIIGNFIDPLIKGFEVHKIVYKERNFPYASARLGGVFAVLAFYFLAGQEPYNLLRTGYYNYLAQEAKTDNNPLLAKEYILQASFLGYNTHYANYTLGWYELEKGADFPAKTFFHSAAQRFPSPYALVNYGNLDAEINPNKVQAIYEEALRTLNSGEMKNNLGLIHLNKGELIRALEYFENANQSDEWNDAPLVNKWAALRKIEAIDSVNIQSDYYEGNFGVKSNILTSQTSNTELSFEYESLDKAEPLHQKVYLLNGAFLFDHDSLEVFAKRVIEESSDATFNSRLRKALALHLYKKGEVNDAFLILDYLQANAHQLYKGIYLDALGKLALDQQANRLALEFFNKALELKYNEALFGKIEAMARLGTIEKIPTVLLSALKQNPELTNRANQVLARLDDYEKPDRGRQPVPTLDSLSAKALIQLGRSNAFHESQVVAVVEELTKREASGGYELLVDATEINPYSDVLLKKYALLALDWSLIEYADQAVDKLKSLLPEDAFITFKQEYDQRKEELEDETW
ncbi:tetratricopeptide repeat protein [Ekhidna sp.]|uniref:tetratricopeptide repeat protein n=1 Tax=Ekhidna sp. TaxID=2608089 RepID=UPI003CCC4503